MKTDVQKLRSSSFIQVIIQKLHSFSLPENENVLH